MTVEPTASYCSVPIDVALASVVGGTVCVNMDLTRRCSEPRTVLMCRFHCFMKSLLLRAVADLVSH